MNPALAAHRRAQLGCSWKPTPSSSAFQRRRVVTVKVQRRITEASACIQSSRAARSNRAREWSGRLVEQRQRVWRASLPGMHLPTGHTGRVRLVSVWLPCTTETVLGVWPQPQADANIEGPTPSVSSPRARFLAFRAPSGRKPLQFPYARGPRAAQAISVRKRLACIKNNRLRRLNRPFPFIVESVCKIRRHQGR